MPIYCKDKGDTLIYEDEQVLLCCFCWYEL